MQTTNLKLKSLLQTEKLKLNFNSKLQTKTNMQTTNLKLNSKCKQKK